MSGAGVRGFTRRQVLGLGLACGLAVLGGVVLLASAGTATPTSVVQSGLDLTNLHDHGR